MHLSPNLDYPWTLRLSDEELTTIQQVLRGDDLSDEEEAKADHMSYTLDKIRPLAEESARRASERRVRNKDRDYVAEAAAADRDFDEDDSE